VDTTEKRNIVSNERKNETVNGFGPESPSYFRQSPLALRCAQASFRRHRRLKYRDAMLYEKNVIQTA
jgi:hypothetical protein